MNKFKSKYLNELLDSELSRGNEILREETGWSKMDLVVRLKNPLSADETEAKAAASEGTLRIFSHTDPHDGSEYGVICERESLVGGIAETD